MTSRRRPAHSRNRSQGWRASNRSLPGPVPSIFPPAHFHRSRARSPSAAATGPSSAVVASCQGRTACRPGGRGADRGRDARACPTGRWSYRCRRKRRNNRRSRRSSGGASRRSDGQPSSRVWMRLCHIHRISVRCRAAKQRVDRAHIPAQKVDLELGPALDQPENEVAKPSGLPIARGQAGSVRRNPSRSA